MSAWSHFRKAVPQTPKKATTSLPKCVLIVLRLRNFFFFLNQDVYEVLSTVVSGAYLPLHSGAEEK